MRFLRRKDPGLQDELHKLEEELRAALHPVSPGQDFVKGLYFKLISKDIQKAPQHIPQKISNTLLVVGGLIGSVIMIITSIRGLISLINILGSLFKRHQTSLV